MLISQFSSLRIFNILLIFYQSENFLYQRLYLWILDFVLTGVKSKDRCLLPSQLIFCLNIIHSMYKQKYLSPTFYQKAFRLLCFQMYTPSSTQSSLMQQQKIISHKPSTRLYYMSLTVFIICCCCLVAKSCLTLL